MPATIQLEGRQIRQILKQHLMSSDGDEAIGILEFMSRFVKAKYVGTQDWRILHRVVRRMADKKRARAKGAKHADD